MSHDPPHLSDEQLLLDIDGESSKRDEKAIRAHLGACWRCRARRTELEQAITEFIQAHEGQFESDLPFGDGPRALLKARLGKLAENLPEKRPFGLLSDRLMAWRVGALVFVLLAVGAARLAVYRIHGLQQSAIVALPNSRLTPGATVLLNRLAVCAQPSTKNKAVSAAVRKQVFAEYGISGADPSAYEVDYLVTPALGGSDDIHNLWPHSYASTEWNAHVKDELEDRLRDMVCEGSIDLSLAQQEIAANWIAAYKKYFHTEIPIDEYMR